MTRVSTTSRKRVPVPSKPSKGIDTRREEAYERLGVSSADVLLLPQISPILGKLPGGIKKALQYLRGSEEPDARKFLSVYDALPESSRRLLPFEAFCQASGLKTKRLLEIVTGACFEQSASTSELLAAASHPDVVAATVRSAKNQEYGGADRKMLHLHAGFVPVPKSQTTIISGNGRQTNIQDNSKNLSISAGEVPAIEDRMARITNRFNTERLGLAAGEEQKRIESTSDQATEDQAIEVVEAEWDDDDNV